MPTAGGRAATQDRQKQAAAERAAALVEDGMTVGLGTGTTVAYLLPALAARGLKLTCVATSDSTEQLARQVGLDVRDFAGFGRLDLAIDGADQVAPDGWLVKGGGGAHTREKIVAAAAEDFVVIVSADKLVDALAPPVPVELMPFGLEASIAALEQWGTVTLRPAAPLSPDGGVIADWFGPVSDTAAVSARLDSVPGLVGHGLFSPELVTQVIVGRD